MMKKLFLCFTLCLGIFGLMLGANLKKTDASSNEDNSYSKYDSFEIFDIYENSNPYIEVAFPQDDNYPDFTNFDFAGAAFYYYIDFYVKDSSGNLVTVSEHSFNIETYYTYEEESIRFNVNYYDFYSLYEFMYNYYYYYFIDSNLIINEYCVLKGIAVLNPNTDDWGQTDLMIEGVQLLGNLVQNGEFEFFTDEMFLFVDTCLDLDPLTLEAGITDIFTTTPKPFETIVDYRESYYNSLSGGGITEDDLNNSYANGYDEGYVDGYDEGYADGKAECGNGSSNGGENEEINALVNSYYDEIINHVAFKYSFIQEYPDYEYLSKDEFEELCINNFSDAALYYAQLYKKVYEYNTNNTKLKDFYYEFRRYPTCDTSRYLSEYDFRMLSFDEKNDYILYVIEDSNFNKGVDMTLLFADGTLDLQKDDPLYDYFCELLLTEHEKLLASEKYIKYDDVSDGIFVATVSDMENRINYNGFKSALNDYYRYDYEIDTYLSTCNSYYQQYRNLLSEYSTHDLSEFISLDEFDTLNIAGRKEYIEEFVYSIAEAEGYRTGNDQGYADGYNEAITQYLNDSNPYILPVNMTANFVAYAIDGTQCWVNDFDIFSDAINHGYNIKNLYRFIHTIKNNIVRPSDVNTSIDSNSSINAWTSNGTGHLHLNFESHIPLSNFNFTITGAKKVTLYLSDNSTIEFEPTGYSGEIPYFNIYGMEEDGSNVKKISRMVLEFNFYDCEKVYSKNDFETVAHAVITSEKNNSEYSKGFQAGMQASVNDYQVAINGIKAEHAEELKELRDEMEDLKQAHATALLEKYNKGYQLGYDYGFKVGENEGYKVGITSTEGYQSGYDAGYLQAQEDNKQVSFWQKISNFFNKIFDAIENAFS